MLHCHEGHDIYELYGKVDFRCDCGNSRMPFSCKLDNEKDYLNEANYYNQTFYDCYCYCKKPHQLEEMEEFMIECHDCEDWFHNHHLNPPLKTNVEEKFILLCKNCVEAKYAEKILHYKGYFYEETSDFLCDKERLQPSTKRRNRGNENLEEKVEKVVTCSEQEKESLLGVDVIIDDAFMESLCQCQECQQAFTKLKRHLECVNNLNDDEKKLVNNLEGIVNEEDVKKPDPTPDYIDGLLMRTMRQQNMSHEGQIFMAENLILFKERFCSFLNEFSDQKKQLTKEDVQKFFEGLNLEKERLLNEHLVIKKNGN